MDTVGNLNHSVSIVGHWIFDSNYKKALPLTTQSLNIMWYPSEGGRGVFSLLESVFYAFIYVNNKSKLNIAEYFMNAYYGRIYMNAGKMNEAIEK